MKLSTWAKKQGITYKTAWNLFKENKISNAYKLESGTIIIPDIKIKKQEYNVIYTRVSSSENKNNLDKQSERLINYCDAKGWNVDLVIKEIGSGLNDNRKNLNKILSEGKVTRLVVEHKDRLTRFGFNYIDILCKHMNCELIVINNTETEKEDLIQDFVSVITSFCARVYGQRRSKRKTEKLIRELENDNITS